MINRYRSRQIFINNSDNYSKLFRDRNLKFIRHFETPKISSPTPEEVSNLNIINHVWSVGDKYYKLAAEYYGDARDWWVIALFNNKPTEADIQIGDIILIPTPLIEAINYFKI